MRIAVTACCLVLVSCVPARDAAPAEETPVRDVPHKALAPVEPIHANKPLRAESPVTPPQATRGEYSGIVFDGVSFDNRSHRLRVVDQPGGPGSLHPDAVAAANSVGGLAAVNGGFFTPEGEPLGRVISSGKPAGTWNSSSSLGSGLWFSDAAGTSSIRRRNSIGRADAEAMRELLQAGPLLVENGGPVAGLDSVKTSARTVILWDGAHCWWIGRTSPATLAQAAGILATAGVPGWQVCHALNLDGGRSSDLWISEKVSGGPRLVRPVWNKPVRNFLVLVRSE